VTSSSKLLLHGVMLTALAGGVTSDLFARCGVERWSVKTGTDAGAERQVFNTFGVLVEFQASCSGVYLRPTGGRSIVRSEVARRRRETAVALEMEQTAPAAESDPDIREDDTK